MYSITAAAYQQLQESQNFIRASTAYNIDQGWPVCKAKIYEQTKQWRWITQTDARSMHENIAPFPKQPWMNEIEDRKQALMIDVVCTTLSLYLFLTWVVYTLLRTPFYKVWSGHINCRNDQNSVRGHCLDNHLAYFRLMPSHTSDHAGHTFREVLTENKHSLKTVKPCTMM